MSAAYDLELGPGRIQSLIDFARREGFHVVRSPGGHFTFTKPGFASIYTGSPPSDELDKIQDAGRLCGVAHHAPIRARRPSATTGSSRLKEVRRA